ncbi:Cell surface lipoprotein MPB83 precursor [Rubripirellula lacrimiformis]|uniref:Cell surface lipoprotein MPB83 n=1 Tax=Rubripirellula lacrimiformis TaxID=1930273 RepID=A0A517NIM8_9BACT|nr:fasciclin domain-containing protein [Rubripirellula lacrimiformis]QDT06989.1 Cell surface lipoprotein MPB83 precursor [Rubripirellula lacrimiformis]
MPSFPMTRFQPTVGFWAVPLVARLLVAGLLVAGLMMILASPVSAAQTAETVPSEVTAAQDAASETGKQERTSLKMTDLDKTGLETPQQRKSDPQKPEAQMPVPGVPANPETPPETPSDAAATDIVARPIIQTAVSAKLYAFVAAVKAAGLMDQFRGSEPITVLMPTDEAFAKLPKGKLQQLLLPANEPALVAVLNNHVFKGAWTAEKIQLLDTLSPLQGNDIKISIDDDDQQISLGTARVIQTDIRCSNGWIHTIDTVLLPQE